MTMLTKLRALKAIDLSSSIDFANPLEWAQWCRDVARAALTEDVEELIALIHVAENGTPPTASAD